MYLRLSVLFAASTFTAMAYSADVTGRVLDLQQAAVPGASVQALSQAGDVLGSGVTDQNGQYQIRFNDTTSGVVLSFKSPNRTDVTLNNIAGTIQGGRIDVVQPSVFGKGPTCNSNCWQCCRCRRRR
jgi:hypothetical protein